MDYENDLYFPIRASELNKQHEIILPHEINKSAVTSKEIIKTCDAVCAEVSFPAIGVGIELGWADAFGKPIFCVYKDGCEISGSLKYITKNLISYTNTNDLIAKIGEILKTYSV